MRRVESGFWAHRSLNAEDPHLQYLRVDGYRPMDGNLNMGGYNITNVGTTDGYNLETQFQNITNALASNIIGPISATDNAIARFDLTTGKLLQKFFRYI